MIQYNLKHVKGEAFMASDDESMGDLLCKVSEFVKELEAKADDDGVFAAILSLDVNYSEDTGNPYVGLYYEAV